MSFKGALLEKPGEKLKIVEVKAEQIPENGVLLKVVASHILPFSFAVVGGYLPFKLPTPYVPGPSCIGIVEECGKNVVFLKKGDYCFCDPNAFSHTNVEGFMDNILLGWFSMMPSNLQKTYKNGCWAEKVIFPAKNLTPIGPSLIKNVDELSILNYLSIAYGAIEKSNFKSGDSVILTGASGGLGVCCLNLLLAMGASKVFAVGRTKKKLEEVQKLDKRVQIVLDTEVDNFVKGMEKADIFIDFLGSTNSADLTNKLIDGVKMNGAVCFAGGVNANVSIPYMKFIMGLKVTGSYMYEKNVPSKILKLISSGVLKLDMYKVEKFKLDKINEAIESAHKNENGLLVSVVTPNN